MSSESDSDDYVQPKSKAQKGKKVEEVYKKTNLREHILKRPDTYIGAIQHDTAKLFIVNEPKTKFISKEVKYSPGLLKIFDEILVNAADNKQRDPTGMTELRVEVNKAKNLIAVYNNGQGVPIQIHKEYNIHVPELIFGQLLTSSNYDDDEKRTVGGRNGFGAKLANIFSTQFMVETCDGKQYYKQLFTKNMSGRDDPEISKAEERRSWTKITFKPDLGRFGMEELEDDIISLIEKRTYDIAGTSGKGLKVFYNNKQIGIKDFKSYCEMHLEESAQKDFIYEQISDRWEIGIAPSDGLQQVSFVNRINTFRGGTHVNNLLDQCVKVLTEAVNKKEKKNPLKPQHFKNHVWIFVNSLIENPTFDTQTKVTLTSKPSTFGSSPKISEPFSKKLAKSSIVSLILAFSKFQESKDLKKTDSKRADAVNDIPKLNDANYAGTARGHKCTLILTEGDSAKSLAVAGVASLPSDLKSLYGIFPLRGKVLNVRDAPTKSIVENVEITHLKRILGLQQGKTYTDTKGLRYGRIMIMTDQDADGSHIKGLLINLFATFWPSLLKMRGFLTEFITPIVKASRKAKVSTDPKAKIFYTLPEYETWREETQGEKWFVKYYKGLGTSQNFEVKEYFQDMQKHNIDFAYRNEECTKLIEMAFSKGTADERKQWIAGYEPGTYLDHTQKPIYYQDFINKELVLFSIASNERAIPSVVDGLKPSERKILFGCFKRNLTTELKVAQLTGYISEKSSYHHGEQSLSSTIVALAQNFVGSNNINYLWPSGQFGTRTAGGKDAASARYIYTHLSPITRHIFHKDDDELLAYRNDDGALIEPDWYVPILPTVLINGSSGIGTGWSSDILNHNPRDLVTNIRKMMTGEEPEEMHPWYKGFIGEVAVLPGRRKYMIRGLLDVVDHEQGQVHIYELPVQEWTGDYKVFLQGLLRDKILSDILEYHDNNAISFLITFTPEGWAKAFTRNDDVGLQALRKFLKLETSRTNTNMVLFDRHGKLKKYESTVEILRDFYELRIEYYGKRKKWLIARDEKELNRIDNKIRFIRAVIAEKIQIRNVKREALLNQLEKQGFDKLYPNQTNAQKAMSNKDDEEGDAAAADESDSEEEQPKKKGAKNSATSKTPTTTTTTKKGSAKDNNEIAGEDESNPKDVTHRLRGYQYLTSLPLMQLTYEQVKKLEAELESITEQLNRIRKATPEQMWDQDLETFLTALDAHEQQERQGFDDAPGKKKKNKSYDMSDDDDFDSDDDDFGKKKKPTKKTAKDATPVVPKFIRDKLKDRHTLVQKVYEEQETEEEKTKRLKREAKATAKLGDVADLLGLDADMLEGTPGATTTKAKPKATRKTKAEKDAEAAEKKATKEAEKAAKAAEKAAAKKPAATRGKKAATAMLDDSDEQVTPMVRPKRAAASASKKVSMDDYDSDFIGTSDDDDDEEGSDSFSGSGSESGSEDDDDEEEESEDSDFVAPKKGAKAAPAAKKAPAPKKAAEKPAPATKRKAPTGSAKTKKAAMSDSEGESDSDGGDSDGSGDDDDDDSDFGAKKPVKKARTTAPKKVIVDSDDEDASEDEKVSLKKSAPKKAAAKKTMIDSDDDESEEEKPKPKKASAPKKKQGASIVDSEEEEPKPTKPMSLTARLAAKGLSSFGFEASAEKTTKEKSPQQAAPKKTAFDFDDSDDDLFTSLAPTKAPTKKAAAASKKTRFDSDSD